MPLNCGPNTLKGTRKYTVELLDPKAACNYAIDFAERLAERDMGIFENQRCPDECDLKVTTRRWKKCVDLRGRWVPFNESSDVYRATAWVDYEIIVECRRRPPPPPPPPPPTIPIGGGGTSTGTEGGGGTTSEPEETTPPPATAACGKPCQCFGPRCMALHHHCPRRQSEATDPSGPFESSGCHLYGGKCSLPRDHQGGHYCDHTHQID